MTVVVEAAAAVVKVQLFAATVLPARSLAPLTRAVYDVPALRLAVGLSVAVVPATFSVTAPARGAVPAPSERVNVEVLTLAGSIASEKVAVTLADTACPVALSAGLTAVTVGAVVSPPRMVMKLCT